MELRLHHIFDHLYNIFPENDGSGNCVQLIEEELSRMVGINDEHDCNVASINSSNIHDASDMQIHKLGDAMFDEDDILVPQVLMSKFIMMKACHLFMMIILLKVYLERS